MTNLAELLDVAKNLRDFATQIRRDSEAMRYPTAELDASLLEKAAKMMEDAAAELERLQRQRK